MGLSLRSTSSRQVGSKVTYSDLYHKSIPSFSVELLLLVQTTSVRDNRSVLYFPFVMS